LGAGFFQKRPASGQSPRVKGKKTAKMKISKRGRSKSYEGQGRKRNHFHLSPKRDKNERGVEFLGKKDFQGHV